MATSLNPFFSNLLIISPTRPRWTASGLSIIKVLSLLADIIFNIFRQLCSWTIVGLVMLDCSSGFFLGFWPTLLVLIDFCPVKSEFLTLGFVYKNFWYFTRNYYWISDLDSTAPHFEFLGRYLDMNDQNLHFAKNFNFDQIYQNTGLKTQNVEELSLDLIFHKNFW